MKWADDLNECFSKEYVQMDNKHTKRWPIPLTIKEVQIKPTMKLLLHTHQNGNDKKKKKKKIMDAGEDTENLEPLYTVGGNVNCCSNYGK